MGKLRRSLALSFLDKYVSLALQIATIAVLARVLTPAETGIYTVAAGLINTAQAMRDFGISNYIIQEINLSKHKLGTALGLSVVFGIGLAGLFIALSGVIAEWFHEPKVRNVVLVLSLNFVIVGFSSIAWAQLQRQGNFSVLAKTNIAAGIGRSIIGITMAYQGYGAVAIAWSSIAGTVISVIGFYTALGQDGVTRPCFHEWRKVLSFGAPSTGASLLQMVTATVPDIIVGRLLGLGQAGLFSRARSLSTLFESSFMGGVRPVAVSSLAKENRDRGSISDLYLKFLDHTTVIAWPLLMIMCALAKPIVLVAFGNQWINAVPASRIVCIAVAFMVIADMTGSAFTAVGAMRPNFMIYLTATPVHILLLVALTHLGIEGAATATCVSALLFSVLSQREANRVLGLSFTKILPVIIRTLLASLVTAVVPIVVAVAWKDTSIVGEVSSLLIGSCGAIFSWLLFVFASNHPIGTEIRALLKGGISSFTALKRNPLS